MTAIMNNCRQNFESNTMHHSQELVTLFNNVFCSDFETILVSGAKEPLYQPKSGSDMASIYFREDFYSSALHEIAHWCLAGEARRKLVDYGYWYNADGRSIAQQAEFFAVEIKPQALEWMFSVATNYPFSVSVDNIDITKEHTEWNFWETLENDKLTFKNQCYDQIMIWLDTKLPQRASIFLDTLIAMYRPGVPLTATDFNY